MKQGSKRGSAVLDAPEQNYALAPSVVPGPMVREPAPAGAFQRAAKFAEQERVSAEHDEPYVPKRTTLAFRLRMAMPKGLAGRLVVASAGLLMVGTAAVAVVGVRRYLTHDPRFAVVTSSDIEISGVEHLTRDQVLSVFGADLERNIFKVPLEERRADLERLPWIAHATVMRLLPNRLRVAIVERTPVAFVRQGTELGLVDGHGVLLDMPAESAGDPHYSFPVLTGLNAADPLSVRAARMAVYAKFMHDLDAGPEHVTQSLSEVDVSNPEDAKALMASGGHDVLVHFGDEDFLNRYHAFQQHLPDWLRQYPKLASADMRYERQVVLEMAQGAATPTANAPPPNTTVATTAALPSTVTPPDGTLAATKPEPVTAKPAAAKPVLVAASKATPVPKGKGASPPHGSSPSVAHLLAVARSSAGKGAAPVVHNGTAQRAQ